MGHFDLNGSWSIAFPLPVFPCSGFRLNIAKMFQLLQLTDAIIDGSD